MSVNRLSTSDTERGLNDVPLVEFMYLQMMYLWWSLCPFNGCTWGGVYVPSTDVPMVEFMYLQLMYLWWSLCTFSWCTCGGVYVTSTDVRMVFMYLQLIYLWWSLCTFKWCTSGGVYVPSADIALVEFKYLQSMYLWWSLCTISYLPARLVTVGAQVFVVGFEWHLSSAVINHFFVLFVCLFSCCWLLFLLLFF